jgi:hypothetical protein
MTRDSIRGSLLGRAAQRRSEVVTLDGTEIEIRQPTVKGRANIFKRAGIKGENTEGVDPSELQAAALTEMCFVPGTMERVFEVTDHDVLVEQACGGWADEAFAKCMSILNVAPVKVAKDLKGDQSASSST